MHCHYGNRCLEIATATNAIAQFQQSCEAGGDQFAFGECSPVDMKGVCSEETGSGLVKNFYSGTLASVMKDSCGGTWTDL
jgi:hypothetical protein